MEVIKASVDRFEGEYAVIYSDKDNKKFDVPSQLMGEIKPGTKVTLTIENDTILRVEQDKKATDEAREKIRKRYQRIREGRHLE